MAGALLERDLDRAVALGALGSPYVASNNYLLLLPALTRLSGWPLMLVWLTTWTGVAVLVFGDVARPLIALFPLSLWLALAWQARRESRGSGC
jgi:hypothetical protein